VASFFRFPVFGKSLVIQCGWQPFNYAEIKINWRKVSFLQSA
jgi:hypothetical protein